MLICSTCPPLTSLFFFNDTATTEIYTLSLHDALPICPATSPQRPRCGAGSAARASSRQPLGQKLREGRVGDALRLDEQRRLRGSLERVQGPERPPRALGGRAERQDQLPCLGVGRALGDHVHMPNLIAQGDHSPWHGSPHCKQGPENMGLTPSPDNS